MTAPCPSPFPTPKPVTLAVALGRRVKECRHQAGKSQEEVAFEAGIDRTYISAVERGAACAGQAPAAALAMMGRAGRMG